jgi:isoleucyl-tRNA synthetase
MEEGKDNAQEFVRFQVHRKITNLYKQFLFILEDMKSEGDGVNEEAFQKARKRILDHGNDSIREVDEMLEKFHFRLK